MQQKYCGYYCGVYFSNLTQLYMLKTHIIPYAKKMHIQYNDISRFKISIKRNGFKKIIRYVYRCGNTLFVHFFKTIELNIISKMLFKRYAKCTIQHLCINEIDYKDIDLTNNTELIIFENDCLYSMFKQQQRFLDLLISHRGFINYPVNIEDKSGQKILKEIAYECMHELFEAIQHLKNSKSHRITNIKDFNKSLFVEEISDCLHYLIEICILSDIDFIKIYKEFMKKGTINYDRIVSGY